MWFKRKKYLVTRPTSAPSVEIRVMTPAGPVLQLSAANAHWVAKYAGYPEGDWYPLLSFVDGTTFEVRPIWESRVNEENDD